MSAQERNFRRRYGCSRRPGRRERFSSTCTTFPFSLFITPSRAYPFFFTFQRSAQYVESYFSGSEKKNVFLTKLIQYVLDKNSVYRYAVGELLADLVKSAFYQPHQMMQQ